MRFFKIPAVFLTTIFLVSCAGSKVALYEGPSLLMSEPTLTDLTFDSMHLTADLTTSPDNDPTAEMLSSKYFLTVADDTVKSDDFDFVLNADGGTTQLDVPLDYETLFNLFGSFGDREDIPAQLHAEIQSRPAGQPDLVATKSTVFSQVNLPILQRPSVFIDTLMLKSFNLANAELEVRLRIVNPNAVPIQVSGTLFDLKVDGTRWHTQVVNQEFEVPVRSDIVINAPFEMRPRDFDTSVYRKLNMAQEFKYEITGTMQIGVIIAGFNEPLTLDFDLSQSQQFERLSN
ncbi:MAG TPA: hypothetical protein DCE78_07685 [Bacteroidetes bacterium]|nr:hypothetical protein [Bacteroidota bacterium]